MYKLYLSTDAVPRSLNKKLRSNRWKNSSENKAWDSLIFALASEKKKPSKPLLRAKICLVRHSHRMLDYDGLVGSLKPVVDALVSCEILKDDSWNILGKWDVDQRFRPKKDGQLLEILIQEMPHATD